jgi:Spy/CpxP family protein refolding chaperone
MMKIFQPAADKFELYAKSAFTTLTKIFENVGKTFGFVINDFFADNKLAIITSLAVGLAAAAGITLGAGKIAGMVAGLGAGLVLGKATSNIQSPDSLQNTINTLDRIEQIDKEQQESRRKTDEAILKHRENLNPLTTAETRKAKETAELMHEQGSKTRLEEMNKLTQGNPLAGIDLQGNDVGFQDPTGSRRKMLRDLRDKMLKERKESLNFNPAQIFTDEVNKNSPVNLKQDQLKNAKIIYEEFIKAGYSDAQAKAAISNAMSDDLLRTFEYFTIDL